MMLGELGLKYQESKDAAAVERGAQAAQRHRGQVWLGIPNSKVWVGEEWNGLLILCKSRINVCVPLMGL